MHTQFTAWREHMWQQEKFREEETGRDVRHFTLTEALLSIGDNHLQAPEVCEQLLLFLDHLARSTFVCKLALAEAGMAKYVVRVASLFPSQLYLVALAGIVVDKLAEEE